MVVRELVTRLGFDADNRKVKQYGVSLQSVRRTAMALVAVKGLLNGAIAVYIRQMAAAGNETAKSAVEANMAVDQYQQLRFVMQRISQVSQNELDRALGNTNIRLQRAVSEGGTYAEVLQMMGHSVQEVADGSFTAADAFDRITEMAQNSETQAQATTAAYQLFGDRVARRLVPALQRADTDVDALRQRFNELGGGFTEEGAKSAEEFEDSLLDMRTAINSIRIEVAERLLPQVREAIDGITEWIGRNRELIRQRLHRAIELVTRATAFLWGFLRRVWRMVDDVVNSFTDWETILRTVLIALGILAGQRIIAGIIALGTALKRVRHMLGLGILAGLIDEIRAWRDEDAASILDEIIGDYDTFLESWNALTDTWHKDQREFWGIWRDMVRDAIKGIFPTLDKLLSPLDQLFPQWMQDKLKATHELHSSNQSNPAQDVQDSQRGGGGTINVTANSTIQVPEGTSSEQQRAIQRQVEAFTMDLWRTQLNQVFFTFPAVE